VSDAVRERERPTGKKDPAVLQSKKKREEEEEEEEEKQQLMGSGHGLLWGNF